MSRKSKLQILPIPLLLPRGLVVLGSGLLVPTAGVFLNLSLVFEIALLGGFLGLLAIYLVRDLLRARKALEAIEHSCSLPETVYSGVPSKLNIELRAKEPAIPCKLRIRPDVPEETTVEREVHVLDLATGTSDYVVPHVFRALSRGKVVFAGFFGRIELSGGLCSWQYRLDYDAPLEALVLPNPHCEGKGRLKAFKRLGAGEVMLDLSGGEGREFESLRRYSPGDDLRKVDWKRSARACGLLVRNYRPETHQRIHVAVDCGRRMGNRIGDRLQIEYAADAASYLIHLAETNEDEVGLFAFSERVVKRIECRRGRHQLRRIVEGLRTIEVGSLEADYQLLTEWAGVNPKRSLLVLITSISNPAGLDRIRSCLWPVRQKHLPIVFAIADRELRDLSFESPKNLDEAFIVSAAAQQCQEIAARAAVLERSGISCVSCDVSELPRLLRSKYYELKLSGRL